MNKFCDEVGFNQYKSEMPIDLPFIIEYLKNGLSGKTTEEIESILFKIHSYNLHIKNKKTSLISYVNQIEPQINEFIANNIDQVEKYLPFDQKKELIVNLDSNIKSLYNEFIKSKAHLNKIGDIPKSLENVISSIEYYLKRRYS